MEVGDYSFHVVWSDEDQEYVGTVREFPFLSHQAPVREEALAGIQKLVADFVADMQGAGEPAWAARTEADRRARIRALADHITARSAQLYKRLS